MPAPQIERDDRITGIRFDLDHRMAWPELTKQIDAAIRAALMDPHSAWIEHIEITGGGEVIIVVEHKRL